MGIGHRTSYVSLCFLYLRYLLRRHHKHSLRTFESDTTPEKQTEKIQCTLNKWDPLISGPFAQ